MTLRTGYPPRFRRSLAVVAAFVLMVMVASILETAYAQGIVYGDTIAAGDVIDNDVILSGTRIQVDGNVLGDMLAIGNTVDINGKVDGSLVVIGQNVTINGEVQGSGYVTGVAVVLGDTTQINRNLYVASLALDMQAGSTIGRDVYAISPGGGTIQPDVGRNFTGVIGPVEFINVLIEWIQNAANMDIFSQLPAGGYTSPSDSVLYSSLGPFTGLRFQQAGGLDVDQILQWLLDRLRELIFFLGIGGVAVWLFFGAVRSITGITRDRPLSAAGWGLIVIIAGFVLLLLAVVAIALVSMFFFAITLNAIGTAVLTVGGAAWLLAFTIFWFLVTYVSKVIIAIFIGQLILERFSPKAASSRVWPLLLGALLYVLLRSIPFLGWIIGVLATVIGVGAMWLAYQSKGQASAFVTPVVEENSATAEIETA